MNINLNLDLIPDLIVDPDHREDVNLVLEDTDQNLVDVDPDVDGEMVRDATIDMLMPIQIVEEMFDAIKILIGVLILNWSILNIMV